MKTLIPVEKNLKRLLSQEDTDNDRQITVLDHGPKRFSIEAVDGKRFEVAGTYFLSNLLQELALARDAGKEVAELDSKYLFENPVKRISRMIRDYYWDGLTRRIDAEGLATIVSDEKADAANPPRIYVPFADNQALNYYQGIVRKQIIPNLQVVHLPKNITPEYVRSIHDAPGILSLALEKDDDGKLRGIPFVVPGGRFNEMYGWDSFFEVLGLLVDNRLELAKAMVDNFVYQITHYGKILNANRSYYLTRSQPPFLTQMALNVYFFLPLEDENKQWFKHVFRTAVHEYHTVWMRPPRLTETGLNRYFGSGLGVPPETEPGHFDAVVKPFAENTGVDIQTFSHLYQAGKIKEPALDEYFMHDRAVRESGHDTSYRLEGCAAHLNTVDLNALLYRYEIDIANAIKMQFDDALEMPNGSIEKSDGWYARAEKRKQLMNVLLWNEDHGMFFDYDFIKKTQTGYVSAATFYPLWANLATPQQAEILIQKALPLLEAPGGLLSGTEASRGEISAERPPRQWDYPFGWAPHQMLLWRGLEIYGYHEIAQRLAYRWLYTIARNATDYNGTIPEKYDVVNRTHNVHVEYGNVGTGFDYITRGGFGWTNASFQVGLTYLSGKPGNSLRNLLPPEWLFTGF